MRLVRRTATHPIVRRWVAHVAALLLSAQGTAALSACTGEKKADPTGAEPTATEATNFVLRDDTSGVWLTWVDDQGEFHVVSRIPDVPAAGREAVRIVSADPKLASATKVLVANLNKKRPDGSYEVSSWTRAKWDELGAAKRHARLEQLAPEAVASAEASAAASAAASGAPADGSGKPGKPAAPKGQVHATIYGASWCGPCHQAERFLKGRGVSVTLLDIDENESAKAEMQRRLEAAGMRGGSIPVISVGGRLLVGFDPVALGRAVDAAQGAQTL